MTYDYCGLWESYVRALTVKQEEKLTMGALSDMIQQQNVTHITKAMLLMYVELLKTNGC